MAKKPQPPSVQQTAIGDGNVQVAGDRNTVNIVQKFFNIFKSDTETLEQRNRRILLGHVENAWIKGVLDASLHGAALLDLGIKPDPEAVTQYPWAIKKESTDETLPAGTSMLEIFDSIGMGRSLLILGAPGSGKTTMLLELARGLIARARDDVTQPIPMVFNLASWTEKLTLAEWLAQELNNLYSVPRKTAPDWVKGNKLLLLLDGLDEVRQEHGAKCVEAINAFRKEHGLTSLAVCSRSQAYADLNAKLSFEGAIEVQPLTQEKIAEFFNRFRGEMEGIKQALEKDSGLREMAETPLFLSIMLMAYRDKQDVEILASGDEKARHKHLFDAYIQRIFERPRAINTTFPKQDILHWLSWLSSKMITYNTIPYTIEDMQPNWLQNHLNTYKLTVSVSFGICTSMICGLSYSMIFELNSNMLLILVILGLIFGVVVMKNSTGNITMIPFVSLNWHKTRKNAIDGFKKGLTGGLIGGFYLGVILCSILGVVFGLTEGVLVGIQGGLNGLIFGLILGIILGLIVGVILGLIGVEVEVKEADKPGQSLAFTEKYFFFLPLFSYVIIGSVRLLIGPFINLSNGLLQLLIGLLFGSGIGFFIGSLPLTQHYALRFILAHNNLFLWKIIPFLNNCVNDLIFLRRVGGGYIFVHRLLMEHFAEMYVETPASKGN